MNRRQFLAGMISATAGVAADPELLLWRPGEKAIFDLGAGFRPSLTPGHSNTLLTIEMITRESLRVLENNLIFTKFMNDSRVQDVEIGSTINPGGVNIGGLVRLASAEEVEELC